MSISNGEDTNYEQLSSREKQETSNVKQAAIDAMHTFMTYVQSGEFDKAEKMFIGDIETMQLPKDGENETLKYTLLDVDVEEDGEAIIIPIELEMAQGRQLMSFVFVKTEEGMKIDIDLSLRKTLGVSPDDLAEMLKQEFRAMQDTMENTIEEIEKEEDPPWETKDTVESEKKVLYPINRKEADALVDIYGRHRGTNNAKLNELNLILFLWEGGQIYMEYLPGEQRLVCGAKIHRFHREIHLNYVDALRAEADSGRDTGGGELVLDPVSKGIFLRRSWNEVPDDQELFCKEVDRLAVAGLVWMEQVYGEVVFPIIARERELKRK